MVEMHNYVPANSLQQKLSNWSHLNRKVLNKLNISVPDDLMRKIVQCPRCGGVGAQFVEAAAGGVTEAQEAGAGSSGWQWLHGCAFVPEGPRGWCPLPPGRRRVRGGGELAARPPGYNQAQQSYPNFVLQIAEKQQELLAWQETVQILQMKRETEAESMRNPSSTLMLLTQRNTVKSPPLEESW
ncbi:Sperm flagellar protein 1 [Heterocephalus glaber]|uniref:Sperm flagellar protein 1 n=1 Tax=Heterocephalus glaber TaxID=10181 RepID=G5AUG2_HETGA|nr:Sperm flagellar protein 1 [Heterocephalus glaber]